MTVAALFVDPKGVYAGLSGVTCWGLPDRDAREYAGPWPVIAHPPCNLWVNFAAVNWKRYGKTLPAWYPGGTDGGCFAAALEAVRRWGGVLEHPADSHAWAAHQLAAPPTSGGWVRADWIDGGTGWACEVYQSAYGHRAQKRTWLYYCGETHPPELDWSQPKGTHQVGWFDRNKPSLGKKAASATPLPFAEALLAMARSARREVA